MQNEEVKWSQGAACDQSLAVTQVGEQSINSMEREEEQSLTHKLQKGQQKGGSTNQK